MAISKISSIVADKMRENGITQAEMADRLGYADRSSIHQKLSGKRSWSLDDLHKISEMFNLTEIKDFF